MSSDCEVIKEIRNMVITAMQKLDEAGLNQLQEKLEEKRRSIIVDTIPAQEVKGSVQYYANGAGLNIWQANENLQKLLDSLDEHLTECNIPFTPYKRGKNEMS